jgi:hypothetical protein
MPDQPKSPPDLAFVRQQIERLTQELAVWKNTEQGLLAVKAGEAALGLKDLFQNMAPYDAICAFLKREGRPQPREVIIRAVIEGGASLGVHKEKSINQSISTNVKLSKLKEKNGLVGMTQWPDDKFRLPRRK